MKARWITIGAGAAIGVGSVVQRQLIRRERARVEAVGEDDFVPAVTERTIPTDDGGEIHVIERGQGPPLVLVHGITLSAAVWGNQLVGHSMGGMVLLRLAADRLDALSERVAGIVLVATSGGPLSRLPYWELLARTLARLAALRLHRSNQVGRGLLPPGDLAYLVARRSFGDHPEPRHVEMTRAIIDDTSAAVVGELLGDVMTVDVGDPLGAVELPALVIVGSKDRLTPPWHARRLAAALPRAELLTLAGCGHMVMLERPRELAAALERFDRWCLRSEAATSA